MAPKKVQWPNPSNVQNSDNVPAIPDNSKIPNNALSRISNQVRKSRSWYGSWPRAPKASASTQVARETIQGGTLKSKCSADFSKYNTRTPHDTSSTEDLKGESPTMSHSTEDHDKPNQQQTQTTAKTSTMDSIIPEATESEERETPATDSATTNPSPDLDTKPSDRPQTSASWFGWMAWNPEEVASTEPDAQATSETDDTTTKNTSNVQAENTPLLSPRPLPTDPEPEASHDQPPPAPSVGWFGLWYGAQVPKSETDTTNTQPEMAETTRQESVQALAEDIPPSNSDNPCEPTPKTASSGSTWAFWSRGTNEQVRTTTDTKPGSVGEIAVMGEGSEAHPKPIINSEVGPSSASIRSDSSTKQSIKKDAKSTKMPLEPKTPALSKDRKLPASNPTTTPSTPDTASTTTTARTGTPVSSTEAPSPQNLLLPSFANTYRMKENPSIIKQITQILLRSQQPHANHVFRSKTTPKIKKAIAIGVHGLFPATYLRPMIGQPTGTSLRFASLCAAAIQRWADNHGCGDCEIEKVALEGEGKIADRVDNLWKLLLNWIEHLRSADLIILACHSQGVPVAIMLLAKLLELGIMTNAKIGVCAMAGVSLGPFPDYKSGILMGSAAELWEFANPESEISLKYEQCLQKALSYGVRVTFIGSIDDQVVPMESAVYSPAHHPYIYRAVFIDGRIHAPDFIAHLVGFALKLRNLGISDHGLVRELSTPLAGSLYSGEGHSRLYYDEQVYDLAITNTLETTNVPLSTPCTMQTRHYASPSSFASSTSSSSSNTGPNPYLLPWAMRGLLEEDLVKTELSAETETLVRQFDDWKPVTKALRDVKYRLEAVRSRL